MDHFAQWAAQFKAGSGNLVEGQRLAWKRREAMRELIASNPAQALALTVPYTWRQALPPEITRFFEQQVDGRGDLNVADGMDFASGMATEYRTVRLGGTNYQAHVYGRRLMQPCRTGIPLHGIALDGQMAVDEEALRRLTPAEAAVLAQKYGQTLATTCCVSGATVAASQAVYAESGGGVLSFSSTNYYNLVNRKWSLAESGGSDGTPVAGWVMSDSWTHGIKKALYMRVNFPDDLTEPISEADAYATMNSVNDFYTLSSYGLTALDATVAPLVTVPQTKVYYAADPSLLLADAREATRQAGYDTANYDLDIVAFTTVPGYTFGGLAYVGGKGIWLQSPGAGVTAHELGHNYGLAHANFWNATANFSGMGPGTNLEYGNPYDTMGAANAGIYQFDAPHKSQLDWLGADARQIITTNGIYRIYPFDVPGSSRVAGRCYAAAVPKDSQRYYWLEFRQLFTGNPWAENGLMLNWSPWLGSDGGTQLIDTTPGSPDVDGLSRSDAAVVVGRTFNDLAAGVHITPLQRGSSGTDPWIECQVNLGAFPSNHPPQLQLETDLTNVPPGGLVHFHATASDPDGDTLAYAWTFDDLTFATNNLPWTSKAFTTPGDHVVRCVVSDMKGGEASANAVVTVGSPNGFRVTGQVTDSNGVPLEGVLVGNGLIDPGAFVGGWTDSQGRYVLVNVTNVNLTAFQFGYTFADTVPVQPTNDLGGVDFVAVPLPTVSVTVDTNTVVKNDGTTHYFTVTRTGDTNSDLLVTFVVAGTAQEGLNYTLDNNLTTTNVMDIPAGTNSLTFTFQALNDGTVDGPLSATLTLLDDPNYTAPGYALVPLAEATITILDGSVPARATVTVVAATPEISENGMDDGEFVFTRLGSMQNDLLVDYSVGGSAAPGGDFAPLAGTVIIPAGQDSAIVLLQPLNNPAMTADKTVTATVQASASYVVGTNASDSILLINDNPTTVTVFPTSAPPNDSAGTGVFTIKRDGDLSEALVVNYTTGGTAVAGVDYVALSGSVTIPAGAASTTVVFPTLDKGGLTPDKYVTLTLTNDFNYLAGTPGTATLYITESELPTVSLSAPVNTVSEQGDMFGQFALTRTTTSGNLTVYLALAGTAVPGWNYLPLDLPVVIPDGSSSVTLDVIPFQDAILDPTMTVQLQLVASTNYNVEAGASTATVKITDDGTSTIPGVGFCFATSAYPESESPGIAVALTVTSAVPVSVDYQVIGGTAAASRYSLPTGTLILSNVQVAFIPLEIVNDTTVEPPQTVRVVLYNPTNATLGAIKVHTYTILDDDAAAVSVTATAASASVAGPVPGNFRITRVGPTNASQLVNFQITGTASAPADYAPLGTSATIPVGATYVDLPVIPTVDVAPRSAQTVQLTLIGATNGTIASPNSATVTISDANTNPLPVVWVSATNQPYAVEGGVAGAFVFTRNGNTAGALTVAFAVGGTAAAARYQALPNTVTIPAGQTSVSLPVTAVDDKLVEGEQTVMVTLTEAETYRSAYPSSATVTIQDNDQEVWVDASAFDASKYGPVPGQFTFARFGTTNTPVTIAYTISGTASNGWDYARITNNIVIPAGQKSVTLPILPLHTGVPVGPVTVKLVLLAETNYSFGSPTNGTVTIDDDMPMLTLTAPVGSVLEGSPTNGDFRLTRTGDPQYDFTAYLAVGGTAVYNVDYAGFLTKVYFSCGVTSIDLTFPTFNNGLADGDHTVLAALVTNAAYTLLSPSNATVVITDAGADQTPFVQIIKPAEKLVYLPQIDIGLMLNALVVTSGTNLVTWSEQNGQAPPVFDNVNATNTGVLFTNAGVYQLRLTADDGTLQSYDQMTVVVGSSQLLSPMTLDWEFDEGSGTVVHDGSGLGHDGVLAGNPLWVSNGVTGGALSFSGTNDWVVQTNGGNVLEGHDQFTLSLWVYLSGTNLDRGIFTASTNGGSTVSLATRSVATCGNYTNVIEATIATTEGVMHRISTNNMVVTNQWQNLVLTWSNGLAPQIYINGALDQPNAQWTVQAGTLTNCPNFIVGRGADSPASWRGMIDDVWLFPTYLSADQILAIAGNCPECVDTNSSTNLVNLAPVVNAGSNATVQIDIPYLLAGTATDDGLPNPPGKLTITWEQLYTNNVTIPNTNSLTNTVVFTDPGDYTFRLTADDSDISTFAQVTITADLPTEVDITADISDAYNLGPVPGDFTLTRNGDTNELTVYMTFSGTSSNGLDYVQMTNVVTFPAGSNSIAMPVMPILNYSIKGDQTVVITLVTNPAYYIGNGQATVTVHDTPYGTWSIQHFTLEQLTHPEISGAGADFSGDGIANFAKYAFNLDPKAMNANPPYTWDFEVDTNDNLEHLTLTYSRILPPRVVQYAVEASTDLMVWSTNEVEEFLHTNNLDGLTETVKTRARMPFPGSTNLFMNIQVWLEQVPAQP